MTKVRKKSMTLLATIAMVCAGCHHGSNWEPSEPDGSISDPEMVKLNVNVDYDVNGTNPYTRADKNDDDGYEPADGDFETVSSLRVIIMRDITVSGSEAWGTVEANRMVGTTASGYPLHDNLEFEVIANEKKRIYLVANESSITSAPTGFASASAFLNSLTSKKRVDLNSLANWTVEIPQQNEDDLVVKQGLYSDVSAGVIPRLPLTECFNISTACDSTDLKNINPDNLYYTQLFITRTAAKATFFVDQENSSPAYDNVNITAITLSGIGSEEYLFPRDTEYSIAKYPDGNNVLGMLSSWSRPSSESLNMYIKDFATPPDSQSLTYLVDGLDEPVVNKAAVNTEREILGPIYFPESILATGKKYEVGVQLSTGVRLTAPLETNILNIDGRDAVARNTHLKITLRFTPVDLKATVTVFPYTAVNLNPEFGFTPPVTDKLTVAPSMNLVVNGEDGLLYPKFTSTDEHTIQNIYWVSSSPSVVLLSSEVTDPLDQRYVEPSQSVELPYLQTINQDESEPNPVRIIPMGVGTSTVTAYTESGLVARCIVEVK